MHCGLSASTAASRPKELASGGHRKTDTFLSRGAPLSRMDGHRATDRPVALPMDVENVRTAMPRDALIQRLRDDTVVVVVPACVRARVRKTRPIVRALAANALSPSTDTRTHRSLACVLVRVHRTRSTILCVASGCTVPARVYACAGRIRSVGGGAGGGGQARTLRVLAPCPQRPPESDSDPPCFLGGGWRMAAGGAWEDRYAAVKPEPLNAAPDVGTKLLLQVTGALAQPTGIWHRARGVTLFRNL